MEIRMRSLAIILVVAVTAGSRPIEAQACRAADAQTTNMIRYMKQLATATLPADSESVGLRGTYQIPAVSAAEVTLVTTERTCKSALTALKSAVPGQSPAPTRVYVVAVGPVFVVWNPTPSRNSEWSPSVVFDSKFRVLSKFGS